MSTFRFFERSAKGDGREALTPSAHQKKIVRGFLYTYLVIMMIPLLAGVVLYLFSGAKLRGSSTQAVRARLEDAAHLADAEVLRYFTAINYLAESNEVAEILELQPFERGSAQISELYRAINRTNKQLDSDSAIFTYHIYSSVNDITISPNCVYLDSEDFYGSFFQWSDKEAPEWYSYAAGTRHDTRIAPVTTIFDRESLRSEMGRTERAVTFLQSLPIHSSLENTGYIALFLKENEFMRLLNGLDAGEDGIVLVMDGRGDVITARHPVTAAALPSSLLQAGKELDGMTMDIAGQSYTVSAVKSKLLGWTYLCAVPLRHQIGILKDLLVFFALVDGAAILLGILFALRLSRRYAKPWHLFLDALEMPVGGAHRTGLLERTTEQVLGVIEGNKLLTARQKELQEQLRTGAVDRLLFTSHGPLTQWMGEMETAGIRLEAPAYCVLRLFPSSGGKEAVHALSPLTTDIYASSVMGGAQYLLLLLKDSGRYGQLADALETIEGVSFAVSSCFTSLEQTGNAAVETRRLHECGRQGVMFAGQSGRSAERLHFPLDFEIQLAEHISLGNAAGVRLLFDKLESANRHCDLALESMLQDQLRTAVARAMAYLNRCREDIFRLSDEIAACPSGEALGFAREDCAKLAEEMRDHILSPYEQIVRYINENFCDGDLCVDKIRAVFSCSASTIQDAVTAQTGQSCSAYLEWLRLNKSCEHLDGGVNICSIPERIGYNNDHSFRRAFKRRFGITPAEYQRLIGSPGIRTNLKAAPGK